MAQTVKSPPAVQEPRFDPCVRKIFWRRKLQPTPVFLPGESHGWRSLAGYSPWGHKESDTTERLPFHFHPLRKLMAPRPRLVGPIVMWVNLKHHCRDFPGGPMVKNLPANAGDASSIPGPGTKIPQALEQLSLHTTKKILYNTTKTSISQINK